jgi:hypothetical protein
MKFRFTKEIKWHDIMRGYDCEVKDGWYSHVKDTFMRNIFSLLHASTYAGRPQLDGGVIRVEDMTDFLNRYPGYISFAAKYLGVSAAPQRGLVAYYPINTRFMCRWDKDDCEVEYVLANTGNFEFMLIDLNTGNRFTGATKIEEAVYLKENAVPENILDEMMGTMSYRVITPYISKMEDV